jgi:hypothetical protein
LYNQIAITNTDDVMEILRDYYHKNITSKKTTSKFLWAEQGVCMRYSLKNWFLLVLMHLHELGEASAPRCRSLLRLHGSRTTSRPLSTIFKHQLVLDQMVKDPAHRQCLDLRALHLIGAFVRVGTSSPTKCVATTLADSSWYVNHGEDDYS